MRLQFVTVLQNRRTENRLWETLTAHSSIAITWLLRSRRRNAHAHRAVQPPRAVVRGRRDWLGEVQGLLHMPHANRAYMTQ
jgi:hypothetical protein